MRHLGSRVLANLLWVVVFSAVVAVGAFLSFATGVLFDDSYQVRVTMPEAGGVLPDQEVTVLGRAVGQVDDVEVSRHGVLITLRIQGDQQVPAVATAQVLRRSPIGEQAVELRPVEDDWTAAEPDDTIEPVEAIVPAPVPFLLEETVDLFANLDPDAVETVVSELATALDGRGERLRMLSRDSLELQETLVGGIPEFERLLDTSETVLATLREQRDALASGIRSGADLTEVFADQRGNVEALLDAGTPALDRSTELILANAANLECLMLDMTAINEMLLGPSTYEGAQPSPYASKLDELERGLITHRFFFQQGFDVIGQYDPAVGLGWVRVLLVADEPASAAFYDRYRPTPVTRPGAACVSEHFGRGVDAVRQPGAQPPHETAPAIDWAASFEDDPAAAAEHAGRPGGQHGADDAPRGQASGSGDTPPANESLAASDEEDAVTALDVGSPSTADHDQVAASMAGLIALIVLPALAAAIWWRRRRYTDG
jgi:virulence factor Mce-like protein